MSLSALDSVDDAIEATKRFLIPFDRARWFRLAVIMLFVGGAGASFPGFPGGGFGSPDTGDTDPGTTTDIDPSEITPELTPELVALVIGLVVFFVAVGLLWAIAGAVMEFVFVQSLAREDVKLWTYFKENWWNGVRLFVFRAVVWLLTWSVVVGVLLAAGVALGGWPVTGWEAGTALALLFLGIPLFLVAFVLAGITLGFTNVFVVPTMWVEDRGLISGWRRFWGTLTANWKEYLVYLVVSILLGFAVGIATGFLGLIVVIVLAIPFLVVGAPAVLVLGFEGIGAMIALVLVLMYAVLVFVAMLLVAVPFQTFLRYYALLVLGDTDADLDVIPETRTAVRADGGDEGDGTDGDGTSDGNGGFDDGRGPDEGPDGGASGEVGGSTAVDDTGSDANRDADRDDESWNVDRDDRS